MNPIQIALTLFLGIAITRVVSAIRVNQISWRRGVLWIALWLTGIFVVWFPDTTLVVAQIAGVKRGVDAVLYVSVALMTYLIFRLYAAIEKQDQVITRLVSELALRELSAPTNRGDGSAPSAQGGR